MATQPQIWGIHAGPLGEADNLFRGGLIALGWEDMGDLAIIAPDREAFKARMQVVYPGKKPGCYPNAAGQLYRFVHEVQPNDLVVWRSKFDDLIRIGRIVAPYEHDSTNQPNFPHRRRVDWINETAPIQITQGARYEIGSAMSFFAVRNYAEEWLSLLRGDAIKPSKHSQPAVSAGAEDPTVALVTEQIEESTRDFILTTLSRELKGHPLALFVGHLLNSMGYRTRISPEGADGGVDIVAHRDELGFEPPIVKVQVKSGGGNVGQPEVSALLGTLGQGEYGLVVTLAGFTPPAKTFAQSKANLRLIDGRGLVDLVLAHYEAFDSRYKGLFPLKRVYVPDPDVSGEEG